MKSEILDRAPPSKIECEKSLLGAIILQPSILPALIEAGFRASFFLPGPELSLANHLLALYASGKPIDATIDRDHRGLIAGILSAYPCLAANWPWYLSQIREAWAQRQAWLAGGRAIQAAAAGDSAQSIAAGLAESLAELTSEKINAVPHAHLAAENPHLPAVIIEGMLRAGETANIIAAPKVGKSWLSYQLALSVATGRRWLDSFDCAQGRVLIVDNELHVATIAARINTSAAALQIRASEFAESLEIISLRGRLLDLPAIADLLVSVQPGTFSLIILDALYRAWPAGASENDNAAVAQLFNRMDQIADRLGCGWVNIHHASKGSQGEKSVVDVGAGAGSQARAADSHLVLRPHEDAGVVVLEAAVRSFPPVEPLALRWTFPLWIADEADPRLLKGRLTQQEQRTSERDLEAAESIVEALEAGGCTPRVLRAKTNLSRERLQKILDRMEAAGRIVSGGVDVRGIARKEYRLTSIPEAGDSDGRSGRPTCD